VTANGEHETDTVEPKRFDHFTPGETLNSSFDVFLQFGLVQHVTSD